MADDVNKVAFEKAIDVVLDMQEKLIAKTITRVPVQNNFFHCKAFYQDDSARLNCGRLLIKFKINGEERTMECETDKIDMITQESMQLLVEKVCNKIGLDLGRMIYGEINMGLAYANRPR